MSSESTVLWSAYPNLDDRPTDLELQLDNGSFYVHKDVLERSSDYFMAMFRSSMIEQSKEMIKLHCVSCSPFKILLQSFYTGYLQNKYDIEEMFSVAETAQMLQVNARLHKQCITFFKDSINYNNCFQIMSFSFEFSMQDIYNHARRFCLAYFIDLWQRSSFLKLSKADLVAYLSDSNLCVDHEAEVLEALRAWIRGSGHSYTVDQCTEMISACVHLKNSPKALAIAKQALLKTNKELPLFENGVPDIFSLRHGERDVLMFWSLLNSTPAMGLVDVVRLCKTSSHGVQHDSMTTVLELPGLDVGSAVCCRGPYVYISGGGPGFGKVNWIRQLWRFDSSREVDRWQEVGELKETRRHHGMVAIGRRLFLFGGFGKFRMRNSDLDCFNLDTGTWNRLTPMPTHTTSPVTTAQHDRFFYIDSAWNIHAFHTFTDTWVTVNHSVPLTSMPATPIAMHFLSNDQTELLVVVSQDEKIWSVCDMCWTVEPGTMIPANIKLWDCEETIRHSVVDSGKLLIFFEKKNEEENKEETEWQVKSFDPRDKNITNWLTVRNVRKAQNVLTVPRIPNFFQIGP